jgi:hypothetical protein
LKRRSALPAEMSRSVLECGREAAALASHLIGGGDEWESGSFAAALQSAARSACPRGGSSFDRSSFEHE